MIKHNNCFSFHPIDPIMHILSQTRMAARLLSSLFFLLFSTASAQCGRCVFQSKAAYFPKTADYPYELGACGYGTMALSFYSGHIAAGSTSLFNNGVGCGGCFQVRCKDPVTCGEGVEVVLTGVQNKTTTDLVLSSSAFRAMAKKGMDKNLLKSSTVDVEYKRIPCVYKHHNVSLRVEEYSSKPNRLAIKVLYQGGQTEIKLLEIIPQDGHPSWVSLGRKYGAVWETNEAPAGVPIGLRFFVTQFASRKMYHAENVIPANWKVGDIYDTGFQITDIMYNGCYPCN